MAKAAAHPEPGRVNSRTIVITGASSGIGRAAAIALAKNGAEIDIVGRDPQRTAAVAAETGGTAFLADFDRLDEVRDLAIALASSYERIDVLANNAGGLTAKRRLTVDGFERTVQANHLAPFLLTSLLLPRLVASGARVISTSSVANRFGSIKLDDLNFMTRLWLGGWRAYGASKLMTIAFMRELALRESGTQLTAYSFHPGFVATGFGAESALVGFVSAMNPGGYGVSPEEGAAPLIHLSSALKITSPSGTYFNRFSPNTGMRRQARSAPLAAKLWQRSEQVLDRWLSPL